ncbi:UDP-N-acetylglucosamine-peptide N-acetylglucosaminyltransferase [Phaeobacter sp. HF9A]|uniref:O-linked N-acetylglucosamine transferase, SPINDLY family protein n=1 Tax=Phaeobacter sp. HF9A TaxID=2721561 RepID=UPI001430D877|nr:UDP-N-acetylglucosamine-peptide N-acetylglucosaminyltransferase [Phaeobacter sp. HF9A]NIZ14700.1 UDP-N-acetylglucosamine-peptide N-acetylglucosaminyltransferase [Phaeobacter sp. HF9A]
MTAATPIDRTDRSQTPLYAQGIAFLRQGDFKRAEKLLRLSLAHEEESALCYHYLAQALSYQSDRLPDCLTAQNQAARLAPGNAVFRAALGLRLLDAGHGREALQILETALELDPACPLALPWALRLRRRYLLWQDQAQEDAALAAMLRSAHPVDPLMLLTFCDDPALQLERARGNAERLASQISDSWSAAPTQPREKIRIGYFSADFCEHATMHLLSGMLKQHDRSRFEFYVYDFKPVPQSPQHRLISDFADVYRDIAELDTPQTLALARTDALDIAVDLKGITTDCRPQIFAARVAPVQLSYLGFPGTTGIANLDYMLADPITIPPGSEAFYSEKILRMPACYQPNDADRPIPPETRERARFNLPEEAFIFASFNHPHKVGPREFDLWMQLLREVPNSVLLFYTGPSKLSSALAQLAQQRGIDPGRVIACNSLPQAQHLDRIAQVDLCLDCFAYNAHTTASDAVWAGVPMVTMQGAQFSARVAASILSSVGMQELITDTPEAYMALARSLAEDSGRLESLRHRLRETRTHTALFDTAAYTAHFEALLEKIHSRHLAGLAPDHIALSP